MVFFCCNGCGESLKKQKVDQHSYTCSRFSNVSCIDCNVTFEGKDFRKHTKCVSEAQRYQGHLYQGEKEKGLHKQNTWMDVVREAAERCKNNGSLRGLLVRIAEYDNVPRKRAKFLNFIKNSLRTNNASLVEQAWDAIDKVRQESAAENTPVVNDKCTQPARENTPKNGKSHKRKRCASSEMNDHNVKRINLDLSLDPNPNHIEHNECEGTKKAVKYKLSYHIYQIVSQKKEISLKKLKRKVVMTYLEAYPYKTMEEASRLFEKKVKKVSGISVDNSSAKLTD